ncbi:hypothetical protein SUGI_0718780 [Cryptomeria japonica]|nr:hypothetical protein SUGI_0718780 [Cryptomeria japonica]
MWKLFLLAAIGAGTGYLAGCMKKKRETTKEEETQSSLIGMIATGKQKNEELSLLLSQTADLLQELKGKVNENKKFMKNSDVLPYEIDRHIHDLLQKQQKEKIAELEMQLKSMEKKLCTKETELQQWKNRDGTGQYLLHSCSNSSSNSSEISAQEDDLRMPWWEKLFNKDCPNSILDEEDLQQWETEKESYFSSRGSRLLFHDCFVEECDASVHIASIQKNIAEKDADINKLLPGDEFDVFFRVMRALESQSPNIVSYADAMAMETRDLFSMVIS